MGINIIHKKRFKYQRNIQGKLLIGIIGTHIGVGSTHFAILLSNYISECLGKKTAYIECYPQDELRYLEEAYSSKGKATPRDQEFSLYGVDYYKSMHERKIAEVIGYEYDSIILDLGTDLKKVENEFIRCDKKIVISSLTIWKVRKLENFLERTEELREKQELIYGIPFSTGKNARRISKKYKIPAFSIPYEPNPFVISADTIKMFQKII